MKRAFLSVLLGGVLIFFSPLLLVFLHKMMSWLQGNTISLERGDSWLYLWYFFFSAPIGASVSLGGLIGYLVTPVKSDEKSLDTPPNEEL